MCLSVYCRVPVAGTKNKESRDSTRLAGGHSREPLEERDSTRFREPDHVWARAWEGPLAMIRSHGTWRSLAAHWSGGPGVAGSNPAVPTRFE